MRVLAVDMGATSTKVSIGEYDGERLDLREIGRFRTRFFRLPNDHTENIFWNIPEVFSNVEEILKGSDVRSVSVDSWGVDFGLLDEKGRLLRLPYHYRDDRTEGVMERFFERMDGRRVYEITGIQLMRINTLYQLYSMVLEGDPILSVAKELLMIADLVMYWLSGEKFAEYTLATTTQLVDARKRTWSEEITGELGLMDILPDMIEPGTVVGKLRGRENVEVVAGASHDTAAAVLAVPFEGDGIYISSGTWSLIGVELDEPLISDESFEMNFTNEGGFGGKIRFLKNTTGMWILEECNGEWGWDYPKLVEAAAEVEVEAFYDPDSPVFIPAGEMLKRLKGEVEKYGQRFPSTVAEIARMIYENAVYNYAWVVENIERILKKNYDVIHVVGGSSRNELMNQLLANVTGKTVRVGPAEASTVGNILAQLIALGELGGVEQARELVRRSFEIKTYVPKDADLWKDKYERWKGVLGKA